MSEILIRPMKESDWSEVSRIYQQGIDTHIATFERSCLEYERWNASHLKDLRSVITVDGNIAGWIALTPISTRCVYQGVAEVSIYMHNDYKNIGLGSKLLSYLIEQSEKSGFWTLQSAIIQENSASIRLHEKCGFRMVGYREKIATDINGVWHNTVLMERRKKD